MFTRARSPTVIPANAGIQSPSAEGDWDWAPASPARRAGVTIGAAARGWLRKCSLRQEAFGGSPGALRPAINGKS